MLEPERLAKSRHKKADENEHYDTLECREQSGIRGIYMKIEAIKVENGFLIPFNEKLAQIKKERILIDFEIIDQTNIQEGYAILDELVGFCESKRTDASINHDAIVYKSE